VRALYQAALLRLFGQSDKHRKPKSKIFKIVIAVPAENHQAIAKLISD
jgi:hypothetical protein